MAITQFKIHNSWISIFSEYFRKNPALESRIEHLYTDHLDTLPIKENLFDAFNLCEYGKTKVIIIGQNPYPKPQDANGLAFSTKAEKLPPTLKNIFKELNQDLKIDRTSGDLTELAKQGILFLNTHLTVKSGKIDSHKEVGWNEFTDHIIDHLSFKRHNLVFILWGKDAQAKEHLIDKTRHMIISSSHPSPLSYTKGFKGSKPFSRANIYLKKQGISLIDWSL